VLGFYRMAYVLLGAVLGAITGYLFAKYFVMLFGIMLHLCFPAHYSFDHVMTVLLSTKSWLRPLAVVACAAWAALTCYRFGRASARVN